MGLNVYHTENDFWQKSQHVEPLLSNDSINNTRR
jgi:hypothetical protein